MSTNTTTTMGSSWKAPNPSNGNNSNDIFDPQLYVMNSLTRNKERFITMDGSKRVIWYMCGPTVYAESHMGHARTYLGFDIIRRIMQDYFGYNVTLIMNITDLDDKIIARSIETNVTHSRLSQRYEQEFHRDLQMLNVQPPSVLTRVTEYMDEIVTYISTIIKKDLAYESNGSVYFNVDNFCNCPQHSYCKLAPEQMNDANLLQQGEGSLTTSIATNEKKSPRDFALWKRVKPNEPSWPSPWGPGRPGWHIECSVMASDVMARVCSKNSNSSNTNAPLTCMDIHAGGVDLKFPHHDNEMAQAEAESGQSQWVNYFVHAGHLHIKGLKMSKSLKNFITIQQALEINSPRQVRLLFLLHKYNAPMDYADNTMVHAVECEKRLAEFFHNCKAALRNYSIMNSPQTFDQAAIALQQALYTAETKVDAALRDDFDTPTAMAALLELVKATHVYLDSNNNNNSSRILHLAVRNVAVFVTRILGIFGIPVATPVGFAQGSDNSSDGASREDTLQPVLDALMNFRGQVRDQARNKDCQAILQLCDQFRDAVLPPLGIRLEDGKESVWKLADPAELEREMAQKQADAKDKAQLLADRAAEAAQKDALNQLSPAEYFKQMTLDDNSNDTTNTDTPMYSKFDEESGMPTHDAQGEPLNKNQTKKVQKLYKIQQGKYEKYQK